MNLKREKINLLVTIDSRYVAPLGVMLESYIQTNPDHATDLYLVHTSLTQEDIGAVCAIANTGNICIKDIKIAERWFAGIPVLERLPEESFYRLLAFHYLPADIKKCLYLDPDIIVRKELKPLYELNLEGYYIAAASHLRGYQNWFNKRRLGIKKQKRYVNSGIMLMNLEKIRKDFSLEMVLCCMEENVQKLLLGDQDLVNLLFGKQMMLLPEEIYNLDERTYRYFKGKRGWTTATVENETAIIHYNGKCKPWLHGYEGELNIFYPEIKQKGPAPAGVAKNHIKSFLQITKLTAQQRIVVLGAALFLAACAGSYLLFGKELLRIVSDPLRFREWLDQFGAFDEMIFIGIRAVQTVVKFIPAEPLEIGSGYAWGAIPGMLYCVIGNMIGTLVIFALTRKFGKKILELFLPAKNMKLLAVLEESKSIYILLFFLYLIPGSPKDGFTYFVGLLPVKLFPFLSITFLARMPSVLSSTLCGASLAEKQYGLAVLIFLVTIVLAVLGWLVYNSLMKKREQKRLKGVKLRIQHE